MKRSILVATLVIGSSICSQSFGFDLLDRMLGLKGCGSSSACCEAPCYDGCEPACGLESACNDCCEPACGAESKCLGDRLFGKKSCCEPACGLESSCNSCNSCEPACGLESSCNSCNSCEPACGAEIACEPTCCDSGCCSGKRGLLDKLVGKLRNHHRG